MCYRPDPISLAEEAFNIAWDYLSNEIDAALPARSIITEAIIRQIVAGEPSSSLKHRNCRIQTPMKLGVADQNFSVA